MKARVLTCMTAMSFCAVVATPIRLAAQDQPKQTHYVVFSLGTLGGTSSFANSLNDLGWSSGIANLAGDKTAHAALWRNGSITDLGTLGGPNSAVLWPVKNDLGELAGVAETALIDPYGESWSCSAFFPPPATHHTCQGFVWKDKKMTALPTLGGDNGFATGVNNRGQVVGWAETTFHDPTCVTPQVLQFEAVIWGPGKNEMQQLPPYQDDMDTAATAINDRGQVVGISGACGIAVGGPSAKHAVLWDDGKITDMGNLGTLSNNTPMAINNRGQVAGFAPKAGNIHAFYWTAEGGMVDLGTLAGDVASEATGINDQGQVVGGSFAADGSSRAFIWQDNKMTDLNSLVVHDPAVILAFANDINDFGEITGGAFDPATKEAPAFLAVPLYLRRR